MVNIDILQDLYKKNKKCGMGTGIQIVTADDGNWNVFIDLFNTEYEGKIFDPIDIHKSSNNWVRCFKENQIFKGFGGAENLEDILEIFNKWLSNREIQISKLAEQY